MDLTREQKVEHLVANVPLMTVDHFTRYFDYGQAALAYPKGVRSGKAMREAYKDYARQAMALMSDAEVDTVYGLADEADELRFDLPTPTAGAPEHEVRGHLAGYGVIDDLAFYETPKEKCDGDLQRDQGYQAYEEGA